MMAWLGPHALFIIGSYAATIAALGALTAWIVADARARKRELEQIDPRAGKDRA
jgi:heme exporter protein CcmD